MLPFGSVFFAFALSVIGLAATEATGGVATTPGFVFCQQNNNNNNTTFV